MSLAAFLREVPSAATWILAAIFLCSQLGIGIVLGCKAGKELLKLQMTFTSKGFRRIVDAWGEDELQRFRNHFVLDIVHPVWYSALLALLMANTAPKDGLDHLVWLPLIAGFCDMIENSIHAPMAAQFKKLDQPRIALAALFATLKWLLAVITVVLLIVWKFAVWKLALVAGAVGLLLVVQLLLCRPKKNA